MFKKTIEEDLKKVIKQLDYPLTDIVCTISKNPAFGDYRTNLALQLAKVEGITNKQSPQDIASKIVDQLKVLEDSKEYLDRAESKGGGFINFFIKDEVLLKNLDDLNIPKQSSERIFVEYGHTNPLKEVHIGHLRTFILGESLVRILESLGNKVFHANYQGDIGLHVAKAIWGIKQLGLPSKELSLEERAEILGQAYVKGNKAYEEDLPAKKDIDK